MRHYERRLPHWDIVDQPVFVTFRLHGSLPAHRVFPPHGLADAGKAFVAMDRLLDRGASGPLYLKRPNSRIWWWRPCTMGSGDSTAISYMRTS